MARRQSSVAPVHVETKLHCSIEDQRRYPSAAFLRLDGRCDFPVGGRDIPTVVASLVRQGSTFRFQLDLEPTAGTEMITLPCLANS